MNVLLYVIDCLRSDHVSSYGYSRETTPNIDSVAADGIRYTECSTPATWTRPVSVSLLTGSYPSTHGVRHRDNIFPSNLKRLPQYLSESGFETVGVSTMGNVSSALGYNIGFDSYHDIYKDEEIIQKRRRTSTDREKLLHEEQEEIALPRAEDITDQLVPIIQQADHDLFSFAWSIDPHMPLDPPETHRDFLDEEYSGPIDGSFESLPNEFSSADIKRLQDLYDCEIKYTDEQFGNIIDELKSNGEYEESLIIVLGDHGEAYYEHDHIFHGSCPHDEVLSVPLIIKPPKEFTQRGMEVTEPVSLIDVCPTILDIVGIDPQVDHMQGQKIPPFGNTETDRCVFAETQTWDFSPSYQAVRDNRWKYIEINRPPFFDVLRKMYAHRKELSGKKYILKVLKDSLFDEIYSEPDKLLYDLQNDPQEQENLIEARPEIGEKFESILSDWVDECYRLNQKIEDSTDDEIDSGTMEQLKQLGYAD
ncbi:sulfatase-like hydrolase/transferase [Haladaptatus caseinilyticus]|uniref:sulfatase-like hydrolase/transferase n=1 Tax=Haladaptatus caseinilyticus TaxID=2993314 RepID=UPI00224B3D09|nr:sulfatase-like hydrolase/transferase [Haladaptatus caseinilyticus]